MTLLLLAYCSLAGSPFRQEPLVHSTFASGDDGWTTFHLAGMDSKVTVVHDADHVKIGTGSLKYQYNVKPGELAAAVLPVADGAMAKVQSLRFWVRADKAAPYMIALDEKGGGRYVSFGFARNDWQEVNLGLGDFTQSTDANTPKDPTGKLDPERIQAVSIVDFEQFVVQNPQLAQIANLEQGERNIYLSDFRAVSEPLPSPIKKSGNDITLDGFARPQAVWASLGISNLRLEAGSGASKSLRADYHTTPQHAAGLFKQFPVGTLAAASGITLRLGSSKACKLLIQVENASGGKYNTTFDLPGDKTMLTASLAFPSFTVDNSPDPEGKLVPEHIRQITILDVTGMVDPKDQDNSLWIDFVAGKL